MTEFWWEYHGDYDEWRMAQLGIYDEDEEDADLLYDSLKEDW